jgi:hypothetical protein
MKLTRRNLAISLVATPALSARAEAQANSSPDDAEMAAARERLRSAANVLKDQKIPMAVEPAFQFKA